MPGFSSLRGGCPSRRPMCATNAPCWIRATIFLPCKQRACPTIARPWDCASILTRSRRSNWNSGARKIPTATSSSGPMQCWTTRSVSRATRNAAHLHVLDILAADGGRLFSGCGRRLVRRLPRRGDARSRGCSRCLFGGKGILQYREADAGRQHCRAVRVPRQGVENERGQVRDDLGQEVVSRRYQSSGDPGERPRVSRIHQAHSGRLRVPWNPAARGRRRDRQILSAGMKRATDKLIALQFLAVVLPIALVLLVQLAADARRAAGLEHSRPLRILAEEARTNYKTFTNGAADAVDTGTLGAQSVEALHTAAARLAELAGRGEAGAVGDAEAVVKNLAATIFKGATLNTLMPW